MRLAFVTVCSILALGALGIASEVSPAPWDDPIEGTVREPSGMPVVVARVELRSGGRTHESTVTDRTGAFRLRRAVGIDTESWMIRVSRLGYESVDVPYGPEGGVLDIVLVPTPLELSGFEVEAERDICSSREDDSARAIWEAAIRRHASGLDTLGVASYTLARADTLHAGGLSAPGTVGAEQGQRASAPLLRLSWNRRVEREGYAFPVRRTDRERSYDSWGYPPLEADFAPHFGNESFGRLHEFHNQIDDGAGWVIRFCPRRTNRPFLEGAIEIGPDTVIRRVEWRFRTPDPDEEAGGWASFPPSTSSGELPPLLPTESLTWRTLPDGQVLQRAQWYEGWIMAQGDSVPFLPEREAGATRIMPADGSSPDPTDPSADGGRVERVPDR